MKTEFRGFKYADKISFNKKITGLRKYFMPAYKDIIFNFKNNHLYSLENGKHTYKLQISKMTELIYGKFELIYSVIDGVIILEDITPGNLLLDCYKKLEVIIYGMPCRNGRDLFKIRLANLLVRQ